MEDQAKFEYEEWRPVVGFEIQYEVSNLGQVRRKGSMKLLSVSRETENNSPYPQVNLWKEGSIYRRSIHTLVACAFIGPANGMDVNHIDGVKRHPALSNLEYVTRSENNLHAFDHGLSPKGETHYAAKLTAIQVGEIRRLHGLTQQAIADKYGVNRSLISMILNGKRWRMNDARERSL